VFIQKYAQRFTALILWLAIIGGYWGYASQYDLTPLSAAQQLSQFLQSSLFGPLIFLVTYAVRPLIFFPTSVMTVLAGFLYGPVWGILYALGGDIITAMVAYGIGAYLGQDFLSSDKGRGLLKRYADSLRRNSFESVLIMRLILLNYDLVSYLAGFLRINWKDFIWATILGSLGGIIAYVLAGASIEGDLAAGLPSVNLKMLGISGLLLGASVGVAWYFRRNNKSRQIAD